jgi:hypothetical protein
MGDIKGKSETVMAVDTLYSYLNECLDKAVPKNQDAVKVCSMVVS